MKLSPVVFRFAACSLWPTFSVLGKKMMGSLRGGRSVKSGKNENSIGVSEEEESGGFSIANFMVKNQLSVPLKLTEAYFYPGPHQQEGGTQEFQYYLGDDLNYFILEAGKNENLQSMEHNPIVLSPPSSDVPGGYSTVVPCGESGLAPYTNMTLVFEPTEPVDELQVAVVYLTMGSQSN